MQSLRPMRPRNIPPSLKRDQFKKHKKKSTFISAFAFLLSVGFFASISVLVVASYIIWKVSQDLPSHQNLAKYEPPVMTRIHANNGSLLAEYAKERRIFVPINTVPKLVVGAFLSAEDKNFYTHTGLDYRGILIALYKYLIMRQRLVGASTITQQVAKNFLLSNERSFSRKLKEAILALRIEQAFEKDKILELYLNEIYLGNGSYGIAAAALNYFNKELKDLTIEEAAYLAVLPKAPSKYHPIRHKRRAIYRRNWILDEMAENGYITLEEAKKAQEISINVNFRPFGTHNFAAEYFAEQVRRTMLKTRLDTKDGKQIIEQEGLYGGGFSVRTTLDPQLQKYARKALIDGLIKLDRSKGWRGAVQKIDVTGNWGDLLAVNAVPLDLKPWELGVVLRTGTEKVIVGLRPSNNLDQKILESHKKVEITLSNMKWAGKFNGTDKPKGEPPRKASQILSVGDVIYLAPKNPNNASGPWQLMQIPEVGGGIAVMDPHTGRVLAVVGGFSFSISQFDRSVQAMRQPGSAFKPLVYAAAIDNGYKSTSIVLDAPIAVDQGPDKEVWRPENYDKERSYGPSTLRLGIEKSRNQMTVRLAQDIGMPLIKEYAINKFGVYANLLPVLSMSLGAGETTLMRMVTAYAVLANGGRKVKATLIDRIQNRWGETVWRHDKRECLNCNALDWVDQPEPNLYDDRKQVIDPHTAYQITSMLQGVVERGTAKKIRSILKNMPLAGKTGTTNDSKDIWFVGYSPDLVAGVYIGYDIPQPMGKFATGGKIAAPIFAKFMKMALAGQQATPFRIPSGIKLIPVHRMTGLRAIAGEKDTIEEAFKSNEEPDEPNSFLGYQSADGVYGSVQQDVSSGRGNVY
ncbi:MAG: Penicillin-binding protein 1A [Hyphomicrobiaceae bacterium hypho_1]